MPEDALQQHLRFSDALNRLAESTLGASEPTRVLEAMARIAGTTLSVDRALVYDVRLTEGQAVGLAEWLNPATPAATPTIGSYCLALFGGAIETLTSHRAPFQSHAARPNPSLGNPAIDLLHGQMNIHSLLWHPFAFRADGCHLLAFNQLSAHAWSDEESAFIGAVAKQVSLALEKLGLLEGLAKSEARYRALYDHTPSLFFTVSPALEVTSVNRFAVEHLGYPESELVGHDVLGVFVPEDRQLIARQLQECFAHPGQVFRWEARKTKKDGTVIAVREIARTGLDTRGQAEALVVCDDVTEQKRTEQAMLQAQKLETLGVLVGSIAHDFNNLLGAIVGNAELGLLRLPPESPAREPVELAGRAALRAAELVRQLLSYSAKAPFTRQRTALNELVREIAQLLEITVGQRVRVELELSPDAPAVVTDPTQLRQVLMNLVHNAGEAMEGRPGAVTVRTSVTTLGTGDRSSLPAGHYARLEVTDVGAGIDAATLAHIFDPFFTTKLSGRGLGLSAVRSIAQRHGGGVLVDSTRGVGSTFTVLLPVAADHQEAPSRETPQGGTLPAGATVLVVDDDAAVLGVVVEMMREFGLRPVSAGGVAAAKECFLAHPEIRCALIDLTMPGGGGAPLVRALRASRPTTPVVLMSGFAESEVREALGDQLAGFLPKPFTPAELRAVLVRVLAAQAETL